MTDDTCSGKKPDDKASRWEQWVVTDVKCVDSHLALNTQHTCYTRCINFMYCSLLICEGFLLLLLLLLFVYLFIISLLVTCILNSQVVSPPLHSWYKLLCSAILCNALCWCACLNMWVVVWTCVNRGWMYVFRLSSLGHGASKTTCCKCRPI